MEKGNYNGKCNRTVCTKTEAKYYNYSTRKYYCGECARLINSVSRNDSMRLFGHELCLYKKMEPKLFYRVANTNTGQGLWYDQQGQFTGLIHDKLSFCKNNELQMEYDDKLCGYLSATSDINSLFLWFTPEDIAELEKHGYSIVEYSSSDYWFYDRFQHWVINQESAILMRYIPSSDIYMVSVFMNTPL